MPITIDKPSKYFDTKLYTGTGSTLSISGINFSPDLVWVKRRDTTGGNKWTDAVRGAGIVLNSNATDGEFSQTGISTFNSDGFTVGTASGDFNASGGTYASWNFLGANTTVSNTQGSITSTVSANTTSGFSIVSYTGAGGASTVGHGLGVAPKLIIIKSRSNSTNWILGHNSLGWNKYIALNTTDAVETNNYFNDTAPTSSVFSIFTSVNVNGSGYTYVAYCFAEVKGFSKAFSYTGNGSSDGTFVYLGFRPAFVLIKNTSIAQDWFINDNKRLGYNGGNYVLYPDLSSAEASSPQVDILSNGFKTRTVDAMINNSGYNYVGFAFAEQPFVSSKGIVANAR